MLKFFLKMAFSDHCKVTSYLYSSSLWKDYKYPLSDKECDFQNVCKYNYFSYEFLRHRYFHGGLWCPALWQHPPLAIIIIMLLVVVTLLATTYRPVARGGSVGSEKLPSQIKGPLFCNERSTFWNKRSTDLWKLN